jgi:hypothetical protein
LIDGYGYARDFRRAVDLQLIGGARLPYNRNPL